MQKFHKNWIKCSAFFVTVRAGTAYQKIWRLVNNFFPSHNKVHRSEIPIVLSNLLYHHFITELWHILILWLAKMPNGGMPVFTLIATGCRYRKIFFYKKALCSRQLRGALPLDPTGGIPSTDLQILPLRNGNCNACVGSTEVAGILLHRSSTKPTHTC